MLSLTRRGMAHLAWQPHRRASVMGSRHSVSAAVVLFTARRGCHRQLIHPDAVLIESIDVTTATTHATSTACHTFEVQLEAEEEAAPQTDLTSSSGASQTAARASSATPGGVHSVFRDVDTLDTFARGRIANYLRRMGAAQSSQLYETRRLSHGEREAVMGAAASFGLRGVEHAQPDQRHDEGKGDNQTVDVYLSQLRVPLPAPHGSFLAEGLAEVAKDAELLAAMHAEQICDALGVPIYGLPSTQRKHAEAARKAGRYAPLPSDPVKPQGTRVPPPLRMLSLAVAVPRNGAAQHNADRNDAMNGGDDWRAAQSTPQASRFASASVTEAELVADASPPSRHKTRRLKQVESAPLQKVSEARRPVSTYAWASTAPTHAPSPPPPPSSSQPAPTDSPSWRYRELAWYPWRQTRTPQEVLAEEGEEDMPLATLLSMVNGLPLASAPTPTSSSSRSRFSTSGSAQKTRPSTHSGLPRTQAFDPTEGGLWQMVQPLSTRCSPAPEDALVLPYVYDDSHALTRLRAYYAQHGTVLDDHLSVTHVALPRHCGRMFVVELRLVDVHASITAKGKAQTQEVALNLAAMHAELLIDALGLPLFPKDAARQHRHAEAVKQFGRWACDPVETTADTHTHQRATLTNVEGTHSDGDLHGAAQRGGGGGGVCGTSRPLAPTRDDTLPRPLKQQIGGDDVWLNLVQPPGTTYTRSEGEHIVALHNVLSHHYSDAIEVNPPLHILERAPEILRQWQVTIAENAYPALYVLTRLGDAYKATTLTPVPRCFGVRGGTAVGENMTQAVQLCALHALDTLCALGIPIFTDPAEQTAYLAWRRENGFVTSDCVRGLRRPAFVLPLKHAIVAVEENAVDEDDDKVSLREPTAACVPPFLEDARLADAGAAPSLRRPYLPSYIAEGNTVRVPPRVADTVRVLQLDIPEHFNVFGEAESNETHRVEMGNAARVCVQNYIRHQHTSYTTALRQHAAQQEQDEAANEEEKTRAATLSVMDRTVGGHALHAPHDVCVSPLQPDEAMLWWRQWLADPPCVVPHVFITGYTKQVSVYNFAYLRLPLPNSQTTLQALTRNPEVGAPPSVLALGLALKKKDAERMCFIHAAALLHALADEDLLQRYSMGLPRNGTTTSFVSHLRPHIASIDTPTSAPLSSPPGSSSSGVDEYCKPLMYATMKAFLDSGKYYTPRRRTAHAEGAASLGSHE